MDEPIPELPVVDRPMAELLAGGEGPIAEAARRFIESLDDPDGVISAFQSYTSGGSADAEPRQ